MGSLQIEIHPGLLQKETVEFCQSNNIVVEGWSPFANGEIFKDGVLKKLAEKYDKSIAQIALSWLLEKDIISLSKSITPDRIRENLDIFDIKLDREDIEKIDKIKGYEGFGADPDNIDF